jgi:hypothetical protein
MSRILFSCVFAGCLVLVTPSAGAQEVIHALTGTVSSIDDAGKTITLFLDGGSETVFNELTNHKTPMTIDKRLLADTTYADAFKDKGAYAIIFYFGGDTRTVVALKNLGTGPFSSMVGTVTKFESRERSITVQDSTGATQTFRLSAQTIAENGNGVVDGLRVQIQKGDRVRVVGTNLQTGPEALFVSEM